MVAEAMDVALVPLFRRTVCCCLDGVGTAEVATVGAIRSSAEEEGTLPLENTPGSLRELMAVSLRISRVIGRDAEESDELLS